jgi:hypothetical protein
MSASRPRQPWQPPSLAEMQALLPQHQFLSLLGRGGMGAVFKATQISLNRPVAIKVLPASLLEQDDVNFAARFRQEALTMAKLTHPGIVGVFESGEAGGLLYIVMEFVDGRDVAWMIQREGKLSSELTTKILTQVCDALHYAHQRGVVHRDIKPANLLLTRDGTVKIADFGLAKHHDDVLLGLTKTNVAIGTPDFLAPEAWTPNAPLDARADLYSLGVTLYQMLTGEVPRGFWEMPSARVGTDPRFDAVIERAMQPKPETRYQSSAELRRDLEMIQREPARQETPSAIHVAGQASPKLRRAALALIAVAVALTGLLVALLWPRSPKENSTPLAAVATNVVSRPAPTVRDAAHWLVQERAEFKILSVGLEIDVKSEQDLPEGDFEIVYLWFDRWASSPPQAPPPEDEFAVLHAVKTLRYAFLRLPGVSGASLAFLASNTNLTTLIIACPGGITDDVLVHLTGLSKLEKLEIAHAPGLTGRKFAGSSWLTSVQKVDFLQTSLGDDALRLLAAGPKLRSLKVERTAITHEGFRALLPLRTLTELHIGGCPNITENDFIETLPRLWWLWRLDLSYAALGDEAAGAIAALTNLTTISMTGTKLTDAGLAKLAKLDRLESLAIVSTRVTAEGITAFRQARPQCQVER